MKISIITVVLNREKTIGHTINSVLNQSYKNLELIIIDGRSSDKTLDIIKSYGSNVDHFLSEDDNGLYDAMNKGIRLSTGEVIGFLNSDDFYANDNVLEQVAGEFNRLDVDSVFANLVYVKPVDINKFVRHFDSGHFKPSLFCYGIAPAHPTFFAKKAVYDKHGSFRTDMKCAADFDLLVRFLYVNRASYRFINKTIIVMRLGGVSTSFGSIFTNNFEILKACKENGIKTNIIKILIRYLFRLSYIFKKLN